MIREARNNSKKENTSMSTEYFYFTGPCKWAKVRKPDEKYQNYTINVYFDKAGLKAVKDTGVTLRPKEDEEPLNGLSKFITFRSPVEIKFPNGETKDGRPNIISADGSKFEGLIGNGSVVTVKIEVYDLKMREGRGHRLQAVRVDDLVKYEPKVEDRSPSSNEASHALPF